VKVLKARSDEEEISIPFPQRTVSGRNEWTDPASFGGDD
jgi:small-conductance mechanosensitive channel